MGQERLKCIRIRIDPVAPPSATFDRVEHLLAPDEPADSVSHQAMLDLTAFSKLVADFTDEMGAHLVANARVCNARHD